MIKLLNLLFILAMFACSWVQSSLPKKEYTSSKIEIQANSYYNMAEYYRAFHKYKESVEMLDEAINLFNMKGDKEKVALCYLRKMSLAILLNNEKDFLKLEKDFELLQKIENLNLSNEMKFIKAKYFYWQKNSASANELINNLISTFIKDKEKSAFYHFYYFSENKTKLNALEIKKYVEEINELYEIYEDGALNNIDILTFSSLQMAHLYASSEQYQEAIVQLNKSKILYKNLENSYQLLDIYDLYISVYGKLNDVEKKTYYEQEKINQEKRIINYLK
jgi:tetratricopeptide (TPR) repeat protein